MTAQYETGPAQQPAWFTISLNKDTNTAHLKVGEIAGGVACDLTLPELEGIYVAVGDVWRAAKVENKRLGKVENDMKDLL